MKPFNLEAALRGEPVVTRQGEPVLEIICFKSKDIPYPVQVVVLNPYPSEEYHCRTKQYRLNGKLYASGVDSPCDLFMIGKEKRKITITKYIGIRGHRKGNVIECTSDVVFCNQDMKEISRYEVEVEVEDKTV